MEAPEKIDEKKGDDVLKRMLKTPPDPKTDAHKKPLSRGQRDDTPAGTSGTSRGAAKD